ncbi:hypothetical protein [Streptomyces sp. NPDC004270]
MTSRARWNRSAPVAALTALLFAGSGALSTASAATTYWQYSNESNGLCLTASTQTSNVWMATCEPISSQLWDWIGPVDPDGDGQHMLKNVANGDCLMTDFKSARNAVWTSACTGKLGEYWDNDSPNWLDADQSPWSLRTSPGTVAVFNSNSATDPDIGIPLSTHIWWGAHT